MATAANPGLAEWVSRNLFWLISRVALGCYRRVPLFGRLQREGLVRAPEYLPEWARDLSYLTAFMSYSAFLGECDLGAERRRYEDLITRAENEME